MPVLIDAFDCCFYSMTVNGNIHPRSKECGNRHNRGQVPCVPAPDIQDMLELLKKQPHSKVKPHDTDFSVLVATGPLAFIKCDITDPDALARACIEVAK